MLLDILVLAALALLLLVSAVELGIGVDAPVSDSRLLAQALAGSAALRTVPWFSLLLLAAYRFVFAATPGQLLAGVRVVASDTGPAPAWRVLARGPALLLSLLPLGLGALWMLRDAQRRTLHDRLTGTRVIEEDESRLSLESLEAAL